jgi:hypothetical protein
VQSFLPVEAEISVTKVWTDGWTNGQGDCNIVPSLWVGGGIKSRLSIQKLDVYMGLYHLHEEKGEKVEDDRQ